MPRVALNTGFYQARGYIAAAQRCVNLYPEKNPPDSPTPYTHYPVPGLTLLTTVGSGPIRGLYQTTTGKLLVVSGNTVYSVSTSWSGTSIGTVGNQTTPVSMVDNGLTAVIVDGTTNGYTVDANSLAFGTISDPAFYGADTVDFIDTYLIFNKPATNQYYISNSEATTFDPLFIAAKETFPDVIKAVKCVGQTLWTIGQWTTDLWFDAGAADFPFQRIPNATIQHGCMAPYSVAKSRESLIWLSQDLRGNAVILQSFGYQVQRISTFAIENTLLGYGGSALSGSVAYTYEQGGHDFYVLSIPAADATWVYDVTESLWHERVWIDTNGAEHRTRDQFGCTFNGVIVVGDWQNGNLYQLDPNAFTDNGETRKFLRTFQHMMDNNDDRVFYQSFIVDIQTAPVTNGTTPTLSLRWSNDRGNTWGNAITQQFSSTTSPLTSVKLNRLGMSRDRVFELSWSGGFATALNGGFVNMTSARS